MIEAAGGVVLRDEAGALEVLVVHRPRYDDWTLPKGKLAAGEDPATAACREVAEETGVRAVRGEELPPLFYPVGGVQKRVRWWLMRPDGGDPAARPPDDEVDAARWVPVDHARALLTHTDERALLATALDRLRAQAPSD